VRTSFPSPRGFFFPLVPPAKQGHASNVDRR
jgi:hypothetical protein